MNKEAHGDLSHAVKYENGYGLSTTLNGTDCYLDIPEQLKNEGMTHMEISLNEDYQQQKALFPGAVDKIKGAGLKIWSVHLPMGRSVSPAAVNEIDRNRNVEKIKQYIEMTKDCDAKTFVIHASFEPVANAHRQALLQSAAKSLNELCDYAGRYHLNLALENLPRSCIGNSIEEMRYFARNVPNIKFCFDVNHFTPNPVNYTLRPLQRLFPQIRSMMSKVNDSPVDFAREFAHKIITVHMSDYDGVDECHWLPGQGIVDFASIHSILINNGFSSPIVFEPNEICRGVQTTGAQLIGRYEKAAKL